MKHSLKFDPKFGRVFMRTNSEIDSVSRVRRFFNRVLERYDKQLVNSQLVLSFCVADNMYAYLLHKLHLNSEVIDYVDEVVINDNDFSVHVIFSPDSLNMYL